METSILTSTKVILGVSESDESFDLDILTFINSSLGILDQLGVGPSGGLTISDGDATWSDLGLPDSQLNLVKTYVFLKVGMLFDPPSTSFVIAAKEKQLEEYEFRLSTFVTVENA